jgi:hypothetical protein
MTLPAWMGAVLSYRTTLQLSEMTSTGPVTCLDTTPVQSGSLDSAILHLLCRNSEKRGGYFSLYPIAREVTIGSLFITGAAIDAAKHNKVNNHQTINMIFCFLSMSALSRLNFMFFRSLSFNLSK